VKPWQAKRILWNTYNFGGNNTTSEDQLKIDIGGYNALIGKSYGELGGEARTMHKSQGEGRPRRRGENYEYFSTTGGDAPKNDLMDGIVTDWKRLQGGEAIETMINTIISNYNIAQPGLSVPALVKLYAAIKELPEGNWRNKKLDEVEQIIIECSALYVEATSSQSQVVQGGNLNINFNLIKRESADATLKNISVENFDTTLTTTLPTKQNVNINKTLAVADDKKISQPYWLVYPLKGGTFDVRDQTMIGKAWNDPSFEASFLVNIDGEDFVIKRPVQYRYIDPVKGDTYQPIPVLPKVELNFYQDNYISINNNPVTSTAFVKSNSGDDLSKYKIEVNVPGDWKKNEKFIQYDVLPVLNKNIETTFAPSSKIGNKKDEVDAEAKKGNEVYNSHTKVIAYNHIPTITYFPKAEANLVSLDIKIVGRKIGYIIGAGDKVPDALEAMGYDVAYLNEADITDDN
ncbi:MAG: PIG-L family deacetylase, partial [Ginsengibacter sp.]